MSKYLYLTYDRISEQSGGGAVTDHESKALSSLGEITIWDRSAITETNDPFEQDKQFLNKLEGSLENYRLAHMYAGCLSESVYELKKQGTITCYTAAAHSVELSRKAHLELGFEYDFPHLNDPKKWEQYLRGYKESDCLVVPSSHSRDVMRGFGCTQRIEIIHHGVEIPEAPKELPNNFAVGYLGCCGGPDKGLRYLLSAWKKLAYKDSILFLGGKDSISNWVTQLISHFGGGNIVRLGWMKNIADFYNRISLYIQPSVSEGWAIEIGEAMSFNRLTLCSEGAGASDISLEKFPIGDVDTLAEKIDFYKKNRGMLESMGKQSREISKNYSWDKIEERYKEVWKSLLD